MIKASTTSKPMPVLSFLEGEGRDGAGRLMIGEILAFNDHQLERRHGFIQWLFALPEPSRAQPQSPILTPAEITAIRESSAAQENLRKAVKLMSGLLLSTQRSLDSLRRSQPPSGQPHHPLTCFVAGRGSGETVSGEDRGES
jgi:Opioid growth factor receptor (OGFr) conserved region